MSNLEFVVAVLAAAEIIEVWRHSYLFAGWRARLDFREGFFADLLRCPFCLAPWVSLLVCAMLHFSSASSDIGLPRPIGILVQLVVYAFAVARASNLLNDYTHTINRTPRADKPLLGDNSQTP